MKMSTDEVAAVFPTLELTVRQAIYIAVLERRNAEMDIEAERLRHHIDILEQATRMPEGISPNGEPELIREYV